MSATDALGEDAGDGVAVANVDFKRKVVVIPVSDVDRAKEFYGSLGWRPDADIVVGDAFRIVRFTPPGSGCSVSFGKGVTTVAPGSAIGELIVSDIAAAREALVGRGVQVSEVFHGSPFNQRDASADRTAGTGATCRTPRSRIRTATRGCCRRSRRGCGAGSTPPRLPSRRLRIWRAR
jgi:hypothetical protein